MIIAKEFLPCLFPCLPLSSLVCAFWFYFLSTWPVLIVLLFSFFIIFFSLWIICVSNPPSGTCHLKDLTVMGSCPWWVFYLPFRSSGFLGPIVPMWDSIEPMVGHSCCKMMMIVPADSGTETRDWIISPNDIGQPKAGETQRGVETSWGLHIMELDEGCPYPLRPVGASFDPGNSFPLLSLETFGRSWQLAAQMVRCCSRVFTVSLHPENYETVKLIHLHLFPRPVGATPCWPLGETLG